MSLALTKLAFFILLLFSMFTAVFGAGILDQNFGTNGTIGLNFGTDTKVADVENRADGKIVIAGTVVNQSAGKDIFVARLNADGSRDASFGTNGVIVTATTLDENVSDLEIQADGRIVLVGQKQAFAGVNTIFDFLVARYTANGQPDNSFGTGGVVTVNQNQADNFNKVAVYPDGRIVAVGSTVETGRLRLIMRFNASGALDSSFASNGVYSESIVQNPSLDQFQTAFLDVEILGDGSIFSGYNSYTGRPDEDVRGTTALKISSAGAVVFRTGDSIFGFFAGVSNDFDADVLPSGNVAVASAAGIHIYNPGNGSFVAKFLQNGAFVAAFPSGKFVVTGGGKLGNIKTYTEKNFVGNAYNLPPGKVAAQIDGKFLLLNENLLSRVINLTSQGTRLADYDNNGKTDLIVDRPSAGKTYFLRSGGLYQEFSATQTPRRFIPEYFERTNVNGVTLGNLVVYRTQSTFFRETGPSVVLGAAEDAGVGGDYDGDGVTDFSVFSPGGDWTSILSATGRTKFYHWGLAGDKAVPADYDGDGITDYAVYRPSTGTWWVLKSGDGSYFAAQFGNASDIPLTGDYDADGRADLAVFRPGQRTWYLSMTTEGFRAVQFGLATDIPVPGDYDGDGKHDIAVFRDGIWYVLQSRDGFTGFNWGTTGDLPVTVRYHN